MSAPGNGKGSGLPGAEWLIGVDDTDNISSRGTGFLVQRLVEALEEAGLGRGLGATRHQLLVDPRIPYTSHNSSACIAWDGPDDAGPAIAEFCGHFLRTRSAEGSDPGLAVAGHAATSDGASRARLADFGQRAKAEILDLDEARRVAAGCGVHASGHGGTEGGIIGAVAAVGLHLGGHDGFFLWMPGIRQLLGEATYSELRAQVPIDAARDTGGREPQPEDRIQLGDWVRPILAGGRAVLLLEPSNAETTPWRVAPREVVRTH
ncbi:MAG TPA: hypothetical protein VHT30_10520 [Acidimicrobiales bacterium]|jgi:hypothetical protein|nr:hypothetical protein [Acidimicrobiales bacterium]